jgi:hypothetical protein
MTPRQLHALRLRQIEQLQHSELMTGIIASVTANFSMMKPEPPFSAESFNDSQAAGVPARRG